MNANIQVPKAVYLKVAEYCEKHQLDEQRFISEALLDYLFDNDIEARERLRANMLKRKK